MKIKVDRKARAKLIRARHKARIKAKRPTHRKLLLHPATVFLLLCVAVLLAGRAVLAHADVTDSFSYSVHAKIAAAPLTQPAIITHPKDGDHSTTTPITLTGSCPTQSYVSIYRNDVFAGTTLCTNDGSFTLQVGLLGGSNQLQAHVFNITDDEGPLSAPITIYYDIPIPPPAPESLGVPKPAPKPFIISSSYSFTGYSVGQNVSLKLNTSRGIGPYAINVKWGDDSESNYVQKASGEIIIDHSYNKSGVYPIKISAVDSAGGSAFLQVQTLVTDSKNPGITGFFTTGLPPQNPTSASSESFVSKWKWLFASTYAVICLMTLSFWLGEQQQYHQMLRASRLRSQRRY